MQHEATFDRREFLGAGLAGTILLGTVLPGAAKVAKVRSMQAAPITAWVEISPDSGVTLIASQSEMGQGTTTTLPAILAHELYLPFERVGIRFAPFAPAYRDPVYNWMFTGNSQSTSSFYDVMTKMGAAAREMLLRAASERLRADPDTLACVDGRIHHRPSGKSVTYGQIASDAAKLPVPANPVPRGETFVGKRFARWDIPGKVDGSAIFGIDVTRPGMLVAAVRCAPRFGAKLAHYDRTAIMSARGVVAIVEVPEGLAVVARTYWQARRAIDAATLDWSDEGSTLTSGAALAPIYTETLARGPFFTHKEAGNSEKAIANARAKLEATYQLPFQAHATMEPMNCTAHVTAKACELWVPTQGVEMAQNVASQVTGLKSEQIVIHRTFLGGGFGRRLLCDFIKQALIVAMAVKQPVKLIWSREEDMTHDFYRPAMLHHVTGTLDEGGNVTLLAHRVVSPSHLHYVFPRAMFPEPKDWTEPAPAPDKIDTMAVEGLLETPYEIASEKVELNHLVLDVPTSVWRTTGHGPNNFVLESFVDELASAAKADPIAFRRKLLRKDQRALNLLNLLAEKSGWERSPEPNVGRGVALAKAFGGYVASVVALSVQDDKIRLVRIVSAVDCGRTLDPGIAESNILGGIVWGLSGMRTAMSFEDGRAAISNFDGFNPFHLWETPACEVHFLDSGETPGGTGELGPVPIHAAVCNAIFALTGRRIRTLPLSLSGLSFA